MAFCEKPPKLVDLFKTSNFLCKLVRFSSGNNDDNIALFVCFFFNYGPPIAPNLSHFKMSKTRSCSMRRPLKIMKWMFNFASFEQLGQF